MDMISTMFEKAKAVMSNAYAPYSKFRVGTCIRTENNQFYVGCNVENASYSLTSCAEASAICQMIASGERRILDVVIIAASDIACAPCGACRQRLWEFSTPETKIHFGHQHGIQKTVLLSALLPDTFDIHNLEIPL